MTRALECLDTASALVYSNDTARFSAQKRGCGVTKRTKSVCVLVSFFFALILGFCPGGRGQAIAATLSGRLVDTSGGSVSKAKVTVASAATGFSRTVQSSDSGEYSVPALPAGGYTVSVEFAGFGKQTKNVVLQIGQAAELDFTLTPGRGGGRVGGAATPELLQTTATQVSNVIT